MSAVGTSGRFNTEATETTQKPRKLGKGGCDGQRTDPADHRGGRGSARELGSGLLESAYCAALAIELSDRKLGFAQEVPISGSYKGRTLGVAYRADLIVEQAVIIEVKALDAVLEIHRSQLLSYLRLAGLEVGLLINFHAFPVATRGIHRLLNKP